MKFNRKILVLAAVLALAFAVTACAGSQPVQEQQSGQQTEQQTEQAAQPEAEQNQPEAEQKPEAEQEEAVAEGEESKITEESAEQPETETTVFDASAAVAAEKTADGVKYVFSGMPQNAEDIKALLEIYPQSDKYNTAAFFIASVVRYIDSPEDGLAMIDVLKGPQPLSDYDKAFIKERFSDKKYLPKAYFEGAVPQNNYEPDSPWTLIIYDDPVSPPEGYSYINVKTSGADSPRRICMRIKGDSHYLWEYNGILMSIRLPAEEDPWV